MICIGIDPGETCGYVLTSTPDPPHVRSKLHVHIAENIAPLEVYNILSELERTSDIRNFLVAYEATNIQPFRPRINLITVEVAAVVRYICYRKGIRSIPIQPSAHKVAFPELKRRDVPELRTPHQFDAYRVALWAVRFANTESVPHTD